MTRRILAAIVVCLMLAARWAATPRPAPASANTEVPSPSADRMWALPEAPTTRPVPQPSPVVATDLLSSQPTNAHEANVSPAPLRGIASTYGPGYAGYLALPQGVGIRVRICGPAACIERVSNDTGPDQRIFPDRIVDVDVATFELVCGCDWHRGLVAATVELL